MLWKNLKSDFEKNNYLNVFNTKQCFTKLIRTGVSYTIQFHVHFLLQCRIGKFTASRGRDINYLKAKNHRWGAAHETYRLSLAVDVGTSWFMQLQGKPNITSDIKKCVHKNLETKETHDAHTGHTECGWWKIEIQIRVKPNGTTALMEVPPRTGWRHLLALDDAKFAISARLGYCKCKFILASRKWTWCSKYSAVFHRLHTSTSILWCSSLVCPFWPLLNHHLNNMPSLFTI